MKRYLKMFSASLVAGLIFLILLVYLFLFVVGGKKGNEAARIIFPGLKKQQIGEIMLQYPGRELNLLMDSGKWFVIKDSKRFNADAYSVDKILDAISGMEIEKIAAESPESLDEFGLNGPRLRVTLKARSDEYSVSVGSETPLGSGIYVKVDGEGRVLIVDGESLMPFLDKTENDFRDRQIVVIDEKKINRVMFRSGGSSFEVERRDDKWVAKDLPISARLDQDRLKLILGAFLDLKADNFEADDPADLSKYGLRSPSAEIEIFEDGNPIRLLFGNKTGNNDRYVKVDSEGAVYSVSEYVFEQIPGGLDDVKVREAAESP